MDSEDELGKSDRELLLDIREKLAQQEEQRKIEEEHRKIEEEKRKKKKKRDTIFGILIFGAALAVVIPLVWALINGWRPYQ